MSENKDLIPEDLGSDREKEIGQHIGYRYDVNLLPDYDLLTPFLKNYMEIMGWESVAMLKRYTHLTIDLISDAQDKAFTAMT